MQKLLLFLFFPMVLSAQQGKIDSLKKILLSAPEDTGKVIALNDIAWYLKGEESLHAEKYGREALDLAHKISFVRGISSAHNTLGVVYYFSGSYDSAIAHHRKALAIRQEMGDKQGVASSFNNIGLVYDDQGKYDVAISFYMKSLRANEEIGSKVGIGKCLNNIALVYKTQGQYDKAIEYNLKSLSIREELGDKPGIAMSYNNLAIISRLQKNFDRAIEYNLKALKMREESGDRQGIAMSCNNLGIVYKDKKEYVRSLEYHLKALEIREKIDDKTGLIGSYVNIGTVYTMTGKYKEAGGFFQKGLDLSLQIGFTEGIKEGYDGLSEVNAQLGNYQSAYEYHKKYSDVKDSLLNEASSKQITEMQTKYETEKKEQQITLLNKDAELKEAKMNRQLIIIWSVAAGFIVVLMLSMFIYKERKKSEKLLLNILPAETAKELKANGKATARHYESVTVMFTDFKGFTSIAEKLSAEDLVSELDFLFRKFDEIISKYNIEKIKTIGDAYMCASGLPVPNSDHAENILRAGLQIQEWMINQNNKWKLRIGIHTGPVTAGVVGDKKFAYDIWGDTVNTASRMESSGEAGKINISGDTYRNLQGFENLEGLLQFTHRGKIPAKNKGEIDMYFVEMKKVT